MPVRARKRFAQHWLQDERVLAEIIDAADLTQSDPLRGSRGDRVLEIGAGTGILTRQLLPQVDKLVSVEIDRDLCKRLVKSFGQESNFLLLAEDFLNINFDNVATHFPAFTNLNKVVANIPYNITGAILENLLGKISQPATTNYELIVLLIQKEVAERLIAEPATRACGALTMRVQYLAECELICEVPAKAFHPKPKVDSAVVRLRPRPLAKPATNPKLLEMLIKVGFGNKRKMLRNNLKGLFDPDYLSNLLTQLQINPQARAEELSLEDWINLSDSVNS